jgi:hypothetical protein
MEGAVMAKQKPGPKPAEGGGRNVLTNIRSTRAWREWVDRYAAFRRMSVADTIDHAIVADARANGFTEVAPPR